MDNKAYNGNKSSNPFNFKNYKINYLSLSVDGRQVPSRAIQPKFDTESEGMFIEAYHTLFSGTGIHFMNDGNCILREMYPQGYTVFAFDFTADLSANSGAHWNLVRRGSVRIDVRFDEALEETMNCLVYAEYDGLMKMDAADQGVVRVADFLRRGQGSLVPQSHLFPFRIIGKGAMRAKATVASVIPASVKLVHIALTPRALPVPVHENVFE